MIQFTLKCADDHRFDSWFQSTEAFDKLLAKGLVSCSLCGSKHVEKAMMAPRVSGSRSEAKPSLDTPGNPGEQALAELKEHVEKNSEYVGMNFAREARDIHDGTAPERAIYGEARPDEAKKLVEDGIPVAPLPFVPGRKSN